MNVQFMKAQGLHEMVVIKSHFLQIGVGTLYKSQLSNILSIRNSVSKGFEDIAHKDDSNVTNCVRFSSR